MPPTLEASYSLKTSSPGTDALTTPSFTPADGEVLVVKLETWDTGNAMGAPTGGGQTFTSRAIVAPGGFRPWVGIYTAVISGAGSMTVSSAPSSSAQYSMTVNRWSGAQLDATPAVGTANASSGAANASVTTEADDSIVDWVASDAQSVDPATRAYLGSATEQDVRNGTVGANGVAYHAYAAAATAGSQSFGLTAPTGMQYCIAGIEVQAAAGATPKSLAEAGSSAEAVTVAATVPLADAGSSAEALTVAAAAALADAGASAEALSAAAAAPLADSAAAAETFTVAAAAALAETASAVEGLAVSAAAALADGGSAADSLSVDTGGPVLKTLSDGGSASDMLLVTVPYQTATLTPGTASGAALTPSTITPATLTPGSL